MIKTGVIDIESNGLLSQMLDYSCFPYKLKQDARLWVVSVTDISTMTTKSLVKEDITKDNIADLIKDYDVLVAHNGVKFDFVVLMLFGLIDYRIGYLGEKDILNGKEVRIIDTLILSRFINPDRFGGHSLDSWGERVGVHKTYYRGELIKLGAIEPSLPKGDEFKFYHPLMKDYCEQDTKTNAYTYIEILKEYRGYDTAKMGLQIEHKLADLAVRRETLGFWFDKDLAVKNVEELTRLMQGIQERVNPLLPKKKLVQTDLKYYTLPAKQFKADGTFTSHMSNFIQKLDITRYSEEDKWFEYKGNLYELPYELPLETETEATVDDLDVVKHKLIELGWVPTEWRERDLTKDAKKNVIPLDKRDKAVEKYVQETLSGKYKEQRLEILNQNEENLLSYLKREVRGNKPVKVPTSPSIRVGVTKDMCPSLVELGDKVSFAKDVADYFTYRHRKSAIAGGDTTNIDFDDDIPESGYLYQMRDEDGRIPTPAIEIGASTNRYRHIGVANIPRASSLFGKEMRGMFGAGEGFIQFGFDYASLEARIEGHYIYNYEGGSDMAVSLLAEKPNDIHTKTAEKLEIKRDDAKSVNYAILYGASANKFVKMLGYTLSHAKQFVDNWWYLNSPLKELKADKDKEWMQSGKKFILSIDGRRINIRSQHSILNALFQSAGVICAKYITVMMFQEFEEQGFCIDVFKGKPDIAGMIEYHDENQLVTKPELMKFKVFNTEDEAKEFSSKWDGEQLGAIQEGKAGKFYITMPNVVSRTITKTISKVEEMFKMNVNLGYEYVTGRNWYECH